MLPTLALLTVLLVRPTPELPPAPDFWLQRSAVHYGDVDEEVLDGLLAVEPQMIQVGFFGAGYLAALGAAQKRGEPAYWGAFGGGEVERNMLGNFIKRAHAQGVRVVGHFSIALTYGKLGTSDGFAHVIDRCWDADRLGPRPPVSAAELLQSDVDGKPLLEGDYEGQTLVRGCPSNPHWRTVLKALVKLGIEVGIDGFTVTFAQREACACSHCQRGFREFLAAKYAPAELQEKFGIQDVAKHNFAAINGFFKPGAATPLALESLKFAQRMLFECEREVLLEYGRRLRPDLIVGQWNHLYCWNCNPWNVTFAQLSGDERCTLPTELWGLGENFVWYSIGNQGGYWKPEQGKFAQFTLEHKFLHEAGGGLPQTIKLDDEARLRIYLAEAVAHGGFGPARGPHYKEVATQAVLRRYFRFLRRHESLYRPIESYAEVGLVFPRRAVHRGDLQPVATFKHVGTALSRGNILFDVILDDNLSAARLRRYQTVLLPARSGLSADGSRLLSAWQSAGGRLETLAADESTEISIFKDPNEQFSRLDAPQTLTWTVWNQPERSRLVIHLVNYDRDLKAAEGKDGPAREQLRRVSDVPMRLRLVRNWRVKQVEVLSPDTATTDPQPLSFKQDGSWLELQVDSVEVYAIVVVRYDTRD